MNKNRLNKERKKIDKIDQQLFKLIKKRTIVVKKMLTFKKFKSEIVDHKRIFNSQDDIQEYFESMRKGKEFVE